MLTWTIMSYQNDAPSGRLTTRLPLNADWVIVEVLAPGMKSAPAGRACEG